MVSMDIEMKERASYLLVHLIFNPPAGAKADLFGLNFDVVTHEVVTHGLNDPLSIGMLLGERKSIVIYRMSVL